VADEGCALAALICRDGYSRELHRRVTEQHGEGAQVVGVTTEVGIEVYPHRVSKSRAR